MEKHIMQPHSDMDGNKNYAANNVVVYLFTAEAHDLISMFSENRTGSRTFVKYLYTGAATTTHNTACMSLMHSR